MASSPCGVARADAAPHAGEGLRQWIAAGHHGEMGWIEDRAEQRASPQRAVARGEIGDRAGDELCPGDRPAGAGRARPSRGRISVYAQGADYHKVVKKALKAMGRWLADEARRAS